MPEPMQWRTYWNLLRHRGPDPALVAYPDVDERGETNLPGVFIIGDAAGQPLLKAGFNQGYDLIGTLLPRLRGQSVPGTLDVVIVGAGAAGLGAATRAAEDKLAYAALEQENPLQIVHNMTRGKILFAEPVAVASRADFPWREEPREALLAKLPAWLTEHQVAVTPRRRVTGLTRLAEGYELVTESGEPVRARSVVLAIGKGGNPRRIGCPGEDRARLDHFLADPGAHRGQDVLIYGGGDVAVEAALALVGVARSVTLATIDPELIYPNRRNREAILAARAAGQVAVHFATRVTAIRDRAVELTTGGAAAEVANDHLFVMIGADPPVKFLRGIGVRLRGDWYPRRYAALAGFALIVYLLYAYAKWPQWPWSLLAGTAVGEWLAQPLGFSPGFWKTALYTLLVLTFGLAAVRRWRRLTSGPRRTFQTLRFGSLLLVQATLSFALPELIARDWHWYHLVYGWPLGPYALVEPGPVDAAGTAVGALFTVGPLAVTGWFLYAVFFVLILMPALGVYTGKSWCAWVCGCGAMSETFGDRWRTSAPKGKRSQGWEALPWTLLLWALLATAAYYYLRATGSGHWAATGWVNGYAALADFWLAGVVAVAAYPFWGTRIWCRYFCPLMKWLEFWSSLRNRVRIVARDNCIACGQCSLHCQMGIDVMAYAKNQQAFGNRETTCIHCGICVAICPMETLSLAGKPEPRP